MAKVRGRRHKKGCTATGRRSCDCPFVIDYVDGAGIRHTPSRPTREQADAFLAEVLQKSRQRIIPTVELKIKMKDYCSEWYKGRETLVEQATRDFYSGCLDRYILPASANAAFVT